MSRTMVKSDYYFGPIKAIYDHIPKECVGIIYTTLCTQLRDTGLYRNKYCTVRVSHLLMHPKTNN